MGNVTENRVRSVSVSDLGIDVADAEANDTAAAEKTVETIMTRHPVPKLDPEHPLLVEVRTALDLGFAGVILSGPPGTGKSYFGERIAHTIASSPDAVTTIQFHASYQYEDFVQGFAPKESGGFSLQDKAFVLACKSALSRPESKHVILIDEISRCDVARVFGEALTYLEVDKRGKLFRLASGDDLVVPPNLTILATMNPWDKGVDELDVALERRFAQVDVLPDPTALKDILEGKGGEEVFVASLVNFFADLQKQENEMVRLGHAYFSNCTNKERAEKVWAYRLLPFFTKACRLDKQTLSSIKRSWSAALSVPVAAVEAENSGEAANDGEQVPPEGNAIEGNP